MKTTKISPPQFMRVTPPFFRLKRETKWFYFFIAPWLIGFVCLSVIPLVGGFLISLSDYDGYNLEKTRFVGLDNYLNILGDQNAFFALGRTLTFAFITVPINLAISFIIALLLNQRILAKGIFRTIFYLPSVIPIVAVIWIWKLMMDNNFGLVNGLISTFLPGTIVRWMSDYPTLVLIMLTIWIGTGGAMIIFMAGLQGVPRELEEAAMIDGARFFQVLRTITLPLLTPVIFYQFVLSIIFSLQILVEPILLGSNIGSSNGAMDGVPPRSNYMYMVHTYNQIFSNQRFGYGSALLWVLFVLILILTVIIFKTSRYWVYYENDQPAKGGK